MPKNATDGGHLHVVMRGAQLYALLLDSTAPGQAESLFRFSDDRSEDEPGAVNRDLLTAWWLCSWPKECPDRDYGHNLLWWEIVAHDDDELLAKARDRRMVATAEMYGTGVIVGVHAGSVRSFAISDLQRALREHEYADLSGSVDLDNHVDMCAFVDVLFDVAGIDVKFTPGEDDPQYTILGLEE